jgi:hypothetical protein
MEIANSLGRLISFDSSAAKKLGDYRAYEYFAFFAESTSTRKVWYAEYARWSEHDGFGYLASIIGDTAEMRQNGPVNKAFIDSINISFALPIRFRGTAPPRVVSQPAAGGVFIPHDLLGRELQPGAERRNRQLVGKSAKQCGFR